MKRYLIGFIVGVLLTFTSTAFAEDISKVGKRIAAEFTVKLDGEELPVKAIALEGTSYAPVRVIAEALGLDVDFQNNEVLLTSKGEGEMTIEELKGLIIVKTQDVEIYERAIERTEGFLKTHLFDYELNPDDKNKASIEETKKQIEEYKERLAEAQQELADLKKQLEELEKEQAAE